MAGQDMSKNLGGMLTDIGQTLGGMGDAYKPVMKAATKPQGDMNDPAHLQRMAQWASNNGDAQAASMYSADSRRIHAERKKVTDATTINTATSAYKKAREGGDAKAILEAEKALIDAANATGQDANARLDAVQRGLSQQEEAAYQQEQRAMAAQDKAVIEKFTQELNSVTTTKEIQDIVDNADPSVAPIAQRAATQRLQYLEAETVRSERDAVAQQEISMEGISINTDLPKGIVASHEAELAGLQEAIKKGKVGGTWEPSVRAELIKRRDALSTKIYKATYAKEMGDHQITNQRRRDRDGKAALVAISLPPSNQVRDDIRKELENKAEEVADEKLGDGFYGFNPKKWGTDREGEITTEMVNDEFRRQQMVALEAEFYDLATPDSPTEATPDSPTEKEEETPADTTAPRGSAANPVVIPS